MQQATLFSIRFGFGPAGSQPTEAETILASLTAPDAMSIAFPAIGAGKAQAMVARYAKTLKEHNQGVDGGTERHEAVISDIRKIQRRLQRVMFARMVDSKTPLRERLALFWIDHFSLRHRGLGQLPLTSDFVDYALRPNITGRFGDLLRATVLHPQMLYYLDQVNSIGPRSRVGLKRGLGLNENLAREIMELHTLGVDGSYTQTDVREFAELLTGVTYFPEAGFQFRPERAEPGRETILGATYGKAKRARLDDVLAFLDELAVHPDTARHMARKLVVHFISDEPDPDHIAHVAEAWKGSEGNLMAVYAALLDHPAARDETLRKVRQPIDFIGSSMRALGVRGDQVMAMKGNTFRNATVQRLDVMAQPLLRPAGPNGWPEENEAWVTPVGLSARIRWAMDVPRRLLPGLPDPRDFVKTALGDAASQRLLWSVGAADSVVQGVGVVLASPEFNRR